MNKKVIGLIIGIMSAAVIGVIALQIPLVRTVFRVNEAQFDKSVANALARVADRLEAREMQEAFSLLANGYSISYFSSEQVALGQPADGSPEALLVQLMAQSVPDGETPSPDLQRLAYNLLNTNMPVEERVDAAELTQYLRQELYDNGISTNFEYGVFSRQTNAYAIHDGIYLAPPGRAGAQQPSYPNLTHTPYRINLFGDTEQDAPAELHVFFPAKSDVLWSDLWLNFLGAFLCAAIILACFGYTVWVIFHQKKISEMKTDFINNMTHEFKTPIATISLAADSITSARIASDPEKVSRFANIIKQENKRMNSQVEKVLQMAQIDKHEFKLRLTDVDLHEVITHAIDNISLQVEKRAGVAEAELLAENPIVEGDLTHISNMVNNLLDNANKYSPDQPHITVITHNRPKGVEVQVKDQGMGMSKEARKHIFDSFYRVHTGDRHDVKGFGLGLSYVKAMITAHHGTVEVDSEPGKGSTFTLFFPFKQ
jgi:two-component system phosphate regulon sensor histidine kinase PhoR